jgi:hypothetical protein
MLNFKGMCEGVNKVNTKQISIKQMIEFLHTSIMVISKL